MWNNLLPYILFLIFYFLFFYEMLFVRICVRRGDGTAGLQELSDDGRLQADTLSQLRL
jgi:hypothetical protein